jgi:hypothetical protein
MQRSRSSLASPGSSRARLYHGTPTLSLQRPNVPFSHYSKPSANQTYVLYSAAVVDLRHRSEQAIDLYEQLVAALFEVKRRSR